MVTAAGMTRRGAAVPTHTPDIEHPPVLDLAGMTNTQASPDLSAERQRALEDGLDQPHLRADRPPFWPTHATYEAMSGGVDWQLDRDPIMVIDGYGYTSTQWARGESPRYDIDRHGAWYDLENGHAVASDQQPEPLPARYGVWQDGDGQVRLMVAEAGTITEVPVETTVTDAVLRDLIADITPTSDALDRLATACAVTTRDVTEFSVDDLEDLLHGRVEGLTLYTWTGPVAPGTPWGHVVDAGAPDMNPGHVEPLAEPQLAEPQLDGIVAEEPTADLSDGLWDL